MYHKTDKEMYWCKLVYNHLDIVHEEDVTFKELGLDSLDQIELEMMVEQKFNIVIIDYDMETIKDMTDLVYKTITEGYGK